MTLPALCPPPLPFALPCCVCLQLVFNPKDTNTFASASLDRTIKVRAGGCGLAAWQRAACSSGL